MDNAVSDVRLIMCRRLIRVFLGGIYNEAGGAKATMQRTEVSRIDISLHLYLTPALSDAEL